MVSRRRKAGVGVGAVGGVVLASLSPAAHGQAACPTIGTGQVSATTACTVSASAIGTTVAAPVAITGTGAGADVTASGVTLSLGVANANGVNALSGARVSLTGGAINTTSNGAAAASQVGLKAVGAGSRVVADNVRLNLAPANSVSMQGVRAEGGGSVTLTQSNLTVGAAGSGRNFNHGLVATGAGSLITGSGNTVAVASNFSNAARAELGGAIELSSSTLTATGTGNAASGPVAAAAAVSGGRIAIGGSGNLLTGGPATMAHGVFVSGTGSSATIDQATIRASGNNSAGVAVDLGGIATLTNSTVSAPTYRGVSVTGNSDAMLTDVSVDSAGSAAIALGSGSRMSITRGTLSSGGQVPTVNVGGVGSTLTTEGVAIVSTGSANAPGIAITQDGLATINGGTVDTFGTTARAQRVKGVTAALPNARLVTNGLAIHNRGDEAIGVAADDGGTIEINQTSVLTDGRNGIAVYAGVDPLKPNVATVVATASHIETMGEIAHGALAQARTVLDVPARVSLTNGTTVITHGTGAMGLRAVSKGRVEALSGSSVTTEGAAAHGAFARNALSLVLIDNATVSTSGVGAHGAVALDAGQVSGNRATVTASNADAAALYVAGYNDTFTAQVPTGADFTASVLTSRSGPAIAVAGPGTVTLAGSTVSGVEWLRVGSIGDFPTLPPPEAPIARPEPLPSVDDPSTPPSDSVAPLAAPLPAIKKPLAVGDVATVDVSASTLTGAATTLPGTTSIVTLRDQTTWHLTGNSTLTTLTNAASQILFTPPSAGTFKTLTVNTYTGAAGGIGLNTVLAGDNAPSDRLVIDAGTASGTTGLTITNAGGTGAITQRDGILVVDAVNGGTTAPGSFALARRAVAGPYEYRLYRGSLDGSQADAWYLRSERDPSPDPPPPGPPTPGQALFRPEVAAYLANQRLAGQMFVHSLHDRLGEPQYVEGQPFDKAEDKPRSGWLRVVGKWEGSRSQDGNFKVDTDSFLLHGGAELAKWKVASEEDRLHLGLMGSYGYASSDAKAAGNPASASGKVEGFSVGAYGTWYQNDERKLGTYIDTWFQYGWFDNKVEGDTLPTVKYHAQGWAVSGELGYAVPLRHDWVIEPQGQLIYVDYREHDITEPNGTRIAGADSTGLITRLGVRLHRTYVRADARKWQPYVTVNWWHTSTDSSVRFNEVPLGTLYPSNRYELKLGLNLSISTRWTGWANVSGAWGAQSFHQYAARIGAKYTW